MIYLHIFSLRQFNPTASQIACISLQICGKITSISNVFI